VRRHQESAFRAAYLVVRDPDEAEDAAQEALISAYKAIGRFREGSAFRPWLLKIVVNHSLNTLKRRKRRAATAQRAAVESGPPLFEIEEELIDRERAHLVWRAVESLKEHERIVVYLRYFLALPERELAEYLNCPAGTVKSRLHRALARLREIVTREYPQLLEGPA
jgi:RNA polymerase sigma-70 factor (ECF subfamily)